MRILLPLILTVPMLAQRTIPLWPMVDRSISNLRQSSLTVCLPSMGDLAEARAAAWVVTEDGEQTIRIARTKAVDSSVRFFVALKKARVSAELPIDSTGGHGLGIRKTVNTASAWPNRRPG